MTRWHLDESALQQLRDRARDDDPLHLFSQSPEDCEDLVSDALAGVDPTRREAFADRLGARRTRFDRISAELVARAGLDPLCLCVIAGKLDTFGVMRTDQVDDDEFHTFIESYADKPSLEGFVEVADGISWRFDCGLTLENMPETVTMAMAGLTLKDVISHPVIDRSSKRIVNIRRETFGETVYTHVELEPSCVMLTAQELLGIAIHRTQDA